jgi:hypothetical protein
VKDAMLAGGTAGAAIASHELESEIILEGAILEGSWVPFPAAEEKKDAAVAPKLQRQILLPGDPGYLSPENFGNTFEAMSQGALKRGEIEDIPRLELVFPGQYNRSGHGIDLVGLEIDRRGRRFRLYRFECKYRSAGSLHELGTTRAGVQYGPEWNTRTVKEFMTADYCGFAREGLLGAIREAGMDVSLGRLGQALERSRVGIIYSLPADVRRLAGQVMAMRRWGVKATAHGLRPPGHH